jgi:hypothetical protein
MTDFDETPAGFLVIAICASQDRSRVPHRPNRVMEPSNRIASSRD